MNGCFNTFEPKICHPPCGGCGLKLFWFQRCSFFDMSPSVWRVWIEIDMDFQASIFISVTLRVEGVD